MHILIFIYSGRTKNRADGFPMFKWDEPYLNYRPTYIQKRKDAEEVNNHEKGGELNIPITKHAKALELELRFCLSNFSVKNATR